MVPVRIRDELQLYDEISIYDRNTQINLGIQDCSSQLIFRREWNLLMAPKFVNSSTCHLALPHPVKGGKSKTLSPGGTGGAERE